MKNITIMLTLTLLSHMAFAGTADRSLNCRSASGRTTLNGSVPGDSANHDFTFSIDGPSLNYVWEYTPRGVSKNSEVQSIGSLRGLKPNFHFVTLNNNKEVVLTFIALPQTINLSTSSSGESGQFSALVVGRDPRNPLAVTPTIQVRCDYDYTI